ncbi:MAG: hypothetical protein ACRBK7_18255 [Acidimicrobiales bacterium]
MISKSSLLPTVSLFIGVAMVASACGISIGENDESATLESTGIGAPIDQNSEDEPDGEASGIEGSDAADSAPAELGDSEPTPAVAAPVATSIPQADEPTAAQLQQAFEQNQAENRAFCEASADYWVASNASDRIDIDRPGEVSMLYKLMDTRLDTAISLAPSEELAEPALVAREHFTRLHDAASEARFDLDVLETGSVYDDLEPSLKILIDIDNRLGTYLVGPCGYNRDSLEAGADSVAVDIARLVDDVLADSEEVDSGRPDGDYPGDYIEIADSADRLKVEVPIHWEDTQSEPSATGTALTIAPDVAAYFTTWKADGIKLTVSDAAGALDWRQPMYETNASVECTLISSAPYSDSLYTGWIDRYDNCAGGPASAVVIGATDEDFSLEILVEVQFDNVDTQNDEATLTQILDTFKAR